MFHQKIIAATVAAAALTGGVAAAQEVQPTVITVQPAASLNAGQIAPFDAPGVKQIREGKPIPSGYALVGREVTIQPGTHAAFAGARITCPSGKTLRTFGSVGQVHAQPGGAAYLGKRSFRVLFDSAAKPRQTVTGTVYGVCR